jgi:two-component system, cell cycle response regulator
VLVCRTSTLRRRAEHHALSLTPPRCTLSLVTLDGSKKRRPAAPLATLKLDEGERLRDELFAAMRDKHRPVLVVMSGNEIGRRCVVNRTLLIGRDPAADLSLTDAGVSWHHARIEDRGDAFTMVDLGSTNGTLVNGNKVAELPLSHGDKVMIARTLLRFEVEDAEDAAYHDVVERMMNVDDLSGLLVRRKFDADLAVAIEAARTSHAALGLLVMDLDGVKKINDTHGHLFGAYTIGEAGRVIGGIVGSRGFACRFGGDEYLAALPGHDLAASVRVGEEIRKAIGAHVFEREGVLLCPGISIGASSFPESAEDASALFQRGDEALYRAKSAGKNRVAT